MIGREVVAQTQGLLEKYFVTVAKILESSGRHGSVGNRDDGAVLGADFRGAQTDVLHRAGAIADFTGVPDYDSLVGQDRNATEQIFKGFLRAKANRQTADTKTRKCRGHVDLHRAQYR